MQLSKHLQKIVDDECNRIRAEIITGVYNAFRKAGYRVSISHDSNNETEKTASSIKQMLAYALDSDEGCDRFWMFAYGYNTKSPAHWALFFVENDVDVLNDYSTSAEQIIAPVNNLAEKYL